MLKTAIRENVRIEEIPGISVRVLATPAIGIGECIVCLAHPGPVPGEWSAARGITCNRIIRLKNAPDKAGSIIETVGYRSPGESGSPIQRRLKATPEEIVAKFEALHIVPPDIVPQQPSGVRKEKFIGAYPRLSHFFGIQL